MTEDKRLCVEWLTALSKHFRKEADEWDEAIIINYEQKVKKGETIAVEDLLCDLEVARYLRGMSVTIEQEIDIFCHKIPKEELRRRIFKH